MKPREPRCVPDAEIEAARTPRGGWTDKQLAKWGVPWPPPSGWRKALAEGNPIPTARTTGDELLRNELVAALAKPIPWDDEDTGDDRFDPWFDVVPPIAGNYAAESDRLMIAALEAVRDGSHPVFLAQWGFAGEFALYVLAGYGLLDYGSSPRNGWPLDAVRDLWQPLIDKWRAYAKVMWPEDEWDSLSVGPTSR